MGMQLKGAMTVLNKEADFLGMTVEEVIKFYDKNPMAGTMKVTEAYEVYKRRVQNLVWCGLNGVRWTTRKQANIEYRVWRGEGHQLELFEC